MVWGFGQGAGGRLFGDDGVAAGVQVRFWSYLFKVLDWLWNLLSSSCRRMDLALLCLYSVTLIKYLILQLKFLGTRHRKVETSNFLGGGLFSFWCHYLNLLKAIDACIRFISTKFQSFGHPVFLSKVLSRIQIRSWAANVWDILNIVQDFNICAIIGLWGVRYHLLPRFFIGLASGFQIALIFR